MDLTTTRTLSCELTDNEVNAYACEVASLCLEVRELEDERTRHAKHIKGQMDGIQADISDLSRKVKSRKEDRKVDCVWLYHWFNGVKQLERVDTREIVETRPIEPGERQSKLDLVAATEEDFEPSDDPEGEGEEPPSCEFRKGDMVCTAPARVFESCGCYQSDGTCSPEVAGEEIAKEPEGLDGELEQINLLENGKGLSFEGNALANLRRFADGWWRYRLYVAVHHQIKTNNHYLEASGHPTVVCQPFDSRAAALVSAASCVESILTDAESSSPEKIVQATARKMRRCLDAWRYVHAGELIVPNHSGEAA